MKSNFLIQSEELLLNLFFPRLCLECGKEGGWICELCQEGVLQHCKYYTSQQGIVSFLDFKQSVIRELLHNLKYNGITEAAKNLVDLVKKVNPDFKKELPGNTIIVPVPTSSTKRKMRGYNQAEELAKVVGSWLDLPLVANVLVRTNYEMSQVGKNKEQRSSQIKGQFTVKKNYLFAYEDRTILLIDDLTTTGSTLLACKELFNCHKSAVIPVAIVREE